MKKLDDDARPFAFLRLTHEAIRVSSANVLALAEAGNDGLMTELAELIDGIEIHAEQEDHGLYPVMDAAFDDVAKKEAYREEHVSLHQDNAKIRALVAADGPAASLPALREWVKQSEEHLVHEEEILQPLASKLIEEDLATACTAVQTTIDRVDRARTETWQIAWVVRHLHAGRPFDKLAKFVHALQHISDEPQYERIKQTLRSALPADTCSKLEDKGLLSAGRL